MNPKTITLIVTITFYVSGIIIIWLGFYLRKRAQRFLSNSVEVCGSVIAIEKGLGPTLDEPVYHPVVTYKDSQGVQHTVKGPCEPGPSPCKVGDSCPIFFPPDKPEHARFGPRENFLYSSRVCFVAGAILIIFGTVTWLVFPPPDLGGQLTGV